MIKYTQIFINNEWTNSSDGKTYELINPATEEKICDIQEAGEVDVDLAVNAARNAFHHDSTWRTIDASQRGELMYKLADLIDKHADELAKLESLNTGKPLTESKIDICDTVKCFKYYAGFADKSHGKTVPMDGKFLAYTRVEPIGVCGQIIPWNYPILMVAWKLGPALCTGNTVVLKPAEQAPLTTLFLANLIKEAGFPKGVVNVVPGFGETGEFIVQHPDVDKIAFTGSTEIGQIIQSKSGLHGTKRVTLEMGGKSPLVIMNDADINLALRLAQDGSYFCQGQTCSASGRVFVQEGIYDEFIRRSKELTSCRKIGDPLSEETMTGPLIDKFQLDKVLHYVKIGIEEGATLICGGERHGEKGYYIKPAIFANVTDEMTIATEELFGPIMVVLKFKTLDEAIRRSNNTIYGLAAGIVTNNINDALLYSERTRAGTVWINEYLPQSAQVPFGGYKMSGHGRELGEDSLKDYQEIKSVVISMASKP